MKFLKKLKPVDYIAIAVIILAVYLMSNFAEATSDSRQPNYRSYDNIYKLCIDGVQYYRIVNGRTLTPAYNPDGTLKTCRPTSAALKKRSL